MKRLAEKRLFERRIYQTLLSQKVHQIQKKGFVGKTLKAILPSVPKCIDDSRIFANLKEMLQKNLNPNDFLKIMVAMRKNPQACKFGQPLENYHNENREFCGWKLVNLGFGDFDFQGEIDKNSGRPDGKGIQFDMKIKSIVIA